MWCYDINTPDRPHQRADRRTTAGEAVLTPQRCVDRAAQSGVSNQCWAISNSGSKLRTVEAARSRGAMGLSFDRLAVAGIPV